MLILVFSEFAVWDCAAFGFGFGACVLGWYKTEFLGIWCFGLDFWLLLSFLRFGFWALICFLLGRFLDLSVSVVFGIYVLG